MGLELLAQLLNIYFDEIRTPFDFKPPNALHQLMFGDHAAGRKTAAVANAICDALADFGVELDRLPLTPELVWRTLQSARQSSL